MGTSKEETSSEANKTENENNEDQNAIKSSPEKGVDSKKADEDEEPKPTQIEKPPRKAKANSEKPANDTTKADDVEVEPEEETRLKEAEPKLEIVKYDALRAAVEEDEAQDRANAAAEQDRIHQINSGEDAKKDGDYFNNDPNRGKWDNQWQFMCATLTHGIGIRSWFLVSYIHSVYGGWPLIIPIAILLGITAYPVFFIETVMGQFSSTGYSRAFTVAPSMAGLAGVMCTLNVATVIYYSVVSSYPLAYVFRLLSYSKPWNSTIDPNATNFADNISAISEYIVPEKFDFNSSASFFFLEQAKRLNSGSYQDNSFSSLLMGLAFVIWVLVFLCTFKGIVVVRKMVYVTTALAFAFAIIICFKGFFPYYKNEAYKPFGFRFGKLLEAETWFVTAVLCIYSLGQGHGIILTLASYNNFRQRIAWMATQVPWLVIIYSSCAVPVMNEFFGYLHHIGFKEDMAKKLGLNFAFLVYPDFLEAVGGTRFWGVAFYLCLFFYEFHSLVMQTLTILTGFYDGSKMGPIGKIVMAGISCGFYAIIAIACAAKGMLPPCDKLFWFGIIIHMLVILGEFISFSWVYNHRRLARDIKCMFGKAFIDNLIKSSTQIFVPPLTIFIIMIMLICKGMSYVPEQYGLVSYGVIVAYIVLALIKVLCVVVYINHQDKWSFYKLFKIELDRPKKWHPAELEHRIEYETNIRNEPPTGLSNMCCGSGEI